MRVAFRKIEEADRRRLHAWRNSPEVARYMYTSHEITEAEHDRWFDGVGADASRPFWIIEGDAEPIGLLTLSIDQAHRRAVLGHYIAEPQAQGKGIGAYVEFCLLDYVFGMLGLNKLAAEVLAGNERARRLHESFGFEIEATFRQHIFKDGAFHDVLGFAILAEDWARARPAAAERLGARGWDVQRTAAIP